MEAKGVTVLVQNPVFSLKLVLTEFFFFCPDFMEDPPSLKHPPEDCD